MTVEISARNYLLMKGTQLGLFETDFRFFISGHVILESAVDSAQTISLTEVFIVTLNKTGTYFPGLSGPNNAGKKLLLLMAIYNDTLLIFTD